MAKNFVDELAKHRLLVYFVTLWGATLFLDTVYGLTAWGLDGFYWVGTSVVVDLFFHFSELFAGVMLLILGVKLLSTGFLETLRNERLLVYFLMLWAAIHHIIDSIISILVWKAALPLFKILKTHA